jgi:N6-L-threonylcarbamoyladenine synthase
LFHVTLDSPGAPQTTPRFHYAQLGHTRDDAAGEAFDKVAKLLALGYPGGPVIDKLSRFGNSHAVDFGHIKMKGNPLDFSFSGLKTAVLYRVRGTELAQEAESRRAWRKAAENPNLDDLRGHCSEATIDLIASFQHAVVQDLLQRTLAAAEDCRVDNIFVSGGVACNSLLRRCFTDRCKGFHVFFPSPALSTDNAAMIAAAGYFKLLAGERAGIYAYRSRYRRHVHRLRGPGSGAVLRSAREGFAGAKAWCGKLSSFPRSEVVFSRTAALSALTVWRAVDPDVRESIN